MELAILIGLIILNGVFSMSEIAVVSSRAARLQRFADEGRHGAGRALALHKAPSTFLSTIQVGITSVGILSGVVGESAFVGPLAEHIGRFPPAAPYAEGLALGIVVAVLTYVTVRFRDLVGAEHLPGEEEGDFHTLAGFVLHHLGRIPAAADRFDVAGLSFEVVDMDHNRIDKLIVARAPQPG